MPEFEQHSPESEAADYEVNVGDVMHVKRNLRDETTGALLRDDEGKIQKKLQDGWEVIDTQYFNPITKQTEILLQNTANPNEAKPVAEWRLREIQEEAEEDIASRAAARMMGLEEQQTRPTPHVEVDSVLEKFHEEIAQDLGVTATDEVVEVAEEVEEAQEVVAIEEGGEEADEERESHELIDAALSQFQIRERYATDELQEGVSRLLGSLDAESGAFNSTVNVLRTTETLKLSIENAVRQHDESMRQLEGRGIVDYDPRVTLYRQLDQNLGQLHTLRSMVMSVTEQNIVTMKRSTESFERTLKEVEYTADRDESDIAQYFDDLSRNKGIDTPDAPRTEGIRSYLKGVDEPLGKLNKALFDIDESYGEVSETIRKLIESVQRLHSEVQHGVRPDEARLLEVRAGFVALADEQTLVGLTQNGNAVIAAIEQIPRGVPAPAIR